MNKIYYLLSFLLSSPLLAQTNYVVNSPNSTTPANYNTFVGNNAGSNPNMTGNLNSFLGCQAGINNTTGASNTFIGASAGTNNTTASYNTFMGFATGYRNTIGINNTFIGGLAGATNTDGSQNTFMGYSAGHGNQGSNNTIIGYYSGFLNSTGRFNCFLGDFAGFNNTTGQFNTILGSNAGRNVTIGNNNIIISPLSGTAITTSDDNVLLGYNSQAKDGLKNAIAIGAHSRVAASNALILGNGVNVGIGTSTPTSKLEIVADEVDRSGLRLSNLTSNSRTTHATDQFLTVNEKGEVVKARYQLRINSPNEWSDNVFSPSYQLRSLPSVAVYIDQHKHLLGIPSAEQVAKELTW